MLETKGETNMEERSKTNKEIFEQKYPNKELAQSYIVCAEAIGYLKALIEYFPSEKKWAEPKMLSIMTVVLFHSL